MKLPTLMEQKERPILNSRYIPGMDWGAPRSMNLNSLIYWVKRTPECIGILKRIATDIVSDIQFKSIAKPSGPGRTPKDFDKSKEEEAISFYQSNNGKEKILSAVLDWLLTGDAYLWKGGLLNRYSEKELKSTIVRHYAMRGINLNFTDVDSMNLAQEFKQVDEDFNKLDKLMLVPSSMTRIDHNEKGIKGFIQKSKVNPSDNLNFTPEEIIHAKLLEIDGSVYGYSPMESSFMAIKTINAIQDYNYNIFANGAKVDRAWLFSGSVSNDTMDKFEEQMKKYKQVTHAHGDIVLETSAEHVTIEKLNEVTEEMEFRKVAINAVGRLAFAFNMPADTFSAILGTDIRGTAVGSDIEDTGYNRSIISAQVYWEDLLNSQLWNPDFQVNMYFERTFRQDMIRKSQYMTQTIPVVEFLFKHEFPVKDEYIFELMQIPEKYRIEGKINKNPIESQPAILPNMKGNNQQKYSDSKKRQQKPQQEVNKPIGA